MKNNTLGSLIYLRLSRFYHKSNALSNTFLKQYDMTAAQFDVLVQIEKYEPISQSQLADKVIITQAGISKMLTRLENQGYIYKKLEWKTKYICLTESGRVSLEKVFSEQLAFQTNLFDDCLSKDEQKMLMTLLTKLHNHAEII
ncbi:MAG: MarR family winged helix-turn-helix transcriptional regulator [Vagococcus sp.]